MAADRTQYLDLKRLSNYLRFLMGIAVESAVVMISMAIGYLISAIGLSF